MITVMPFVLGFCIAFMAVILPGLINMTAARISLQDGRNHAVSFGVGASVIVFLQTFLSVLFAGFISSHLEVVSMIQKMAVVVFSSLSIYFFYFAGRPKPPGSEVKIKRKSNRFFLGMLLSTLNFLPVPFYVFTSMALAGTRFFSFGKLPVFLFVMGVVLGSFSVFYLYIISFKSIEKKTDVVLKNINPIIGSVTGLVALFTVFKLFGL